MNWLLYLLFIFVLYSFLGWILEEVYCFAVTKHFKEDGFLNGPFKPMYGFAIALLVYLFYIVEVRGGVLLGMFIFIPTIVEYISGYSLRKLFKKDYWNYSNIKFNFDGLVCLRFSICWAILSFFVIYIMQPEVERLFFRFQGVFKIIVPILIIYIALDFIGTIKLFNYGNSL